MDSSILTIWTGAFQIEKKSDKLIFIITTFIEIRVLNSNSVDPDQTSRSEASDLVLHCLLMSNLWDARHKLVNSNTRWYRPPTTESGRSVLLNATQPRCIRERFLQTSFHLMNSYCQSVSWDLKS